MAQEFSSIRTSIIPIGTKTSSTKRFLSSVLTHGVQMIFTVSNAVPISPDTNVFLSDPFNWKHEWTNETIQQEDIGAGRNRHYTSRHHRANEWYNKWLPDLNRLDPEGGKPVTSIDRIRSFLSRRSSVCFRNSSTLFGRAQRH